MESHGDPTPMLYVRFWKNNSPVSISAILRLKLTALSLYLTAIELDPKPIPPEKLRFNALNNLVLFNHRREDD